MEAVVAKCRSKGYLVSDRIWFQIELSTCVSRFEEVKLHLCSMQIKDVNKRTD